MIMPEFSRACSDLKRVELPTLRLGFARGLVPHKPRFAPYLGVTALSCRRAECRPQRAGFSRDIKAPVGWFVVDAGSLAWVRP